jgi:hypothetical protein
MQDAEAVPVRAAKVISNQKKKVKKRKEKVALVISLFLFSLGRILKRVKRFLVAFE